MRRAPTELEAVVLHLLGSSSMSAYQIAAAVPAGTVPILPQQVYRVLNRLVCEGRVRRIELTKRYARRWAGDLALTCRNCGATSFVATPGLSNTLHRGAGATGFKVSRMVLECDGLCEPCTHGPP